MTDEAYDMTTIEGCIGWGLFLNPPERARLEAELARLRAIERAARRHVALYTEGCVCEPCREDRASGLVAAVRARKALAGA